MAYKKKKQVTSVLFSFIFVCMLLQTRDMVCISDPSCNEFLSSVFWKLKLKKKQEKNFIL